MPIESRIDSTQPAPVEQTPDDKPYLHDDKKLTELVKKFGPDGLSKRQCTATKVDGKRCTMTSVRGGFTCIVHGGKSGPAQAAAKMRLLAMVDPAIGVINKILESPGTTCILCGRSDDAALMARTAFGILDRAGFGPGATLEIDDKSKPDLSKDHKEQLLERLDRLRTVIASTANDAPRVVDAQFVVEPEKEDDADGDEAE